MFVVTHLTELHNLIITDTNMSNQMFPYRLSTFLINKHYYVNFIHKESLRNLYHFLLNYRFHLLDWTLFLHDVPLNLRHFVRFDFDLLFLSLNLLLESFIQNWHNKIWFEKRSIRCFPMSTLGLWLWKTGEFGPSGSRRTLSRFTGSGNGDDTRPGRSTIGQ